MIAGWLAFLRSYREECRGFLLHVLTATMRTLGILMIVLVQGQDSFEGLMTVETNIVINGHWGPPVEVLLREL